MITIIPIPAFADNYIWTLRQGGNAVVVDPGDAKPVIDYLDREGLALTAVLATHHHNDHVGGVPALVERYRAAVFGPARESIPARTRALGEGDEIDVPGLALRLRVMDIPGHTAGHIAYFGDVSGTPSLFCGDTMFAAGCGRLFEGTPQQMWRSLSALAALPPRHARLLRARVHARQHPLRARGRAAQRRPAGSPGPRAGQARSRRADASFHDRRRAPHQSVPSRAHSRGAKGGCGARRRAAGDRRRDLRGVASLEERILVPGPRG